MIDPENARTSVIKVKRKRNEKEWTDNKRKFLRAVGDEYISKRGKIIPKRTTGIMCR